MSSGAIPVTFFRSSDVETSGSSYNLLLARHFTKCVTYKQLRVVGGVMRALVFLSPMICVWGSIPGLGVISGLSLLVLYSAPRGFSPGSPVFPSLQKPTFDLI